MGGKRVTQEEFVERSIEIHGDTYDYSLVEYDKKTTKVKIICHEHGVFEQSPKQHLRGRGCFECGKRKCIRKSNVDEFIFKSKEMHGNTYDYSLVEYKTNRDKVRIICPIHGGFEQSPCHHISGQGCPKCRYIKSGLSGRLTQKQCLDDFVRVHGDIYDYSLVRYNTDRDKVKIICHEHGVFEQLPLNHKRGQGCPECKVNDMRSNTDEFIEKSILIHGSKYNYSLVDYTDSKTKIKIICPDHGIFKQRPNNHLNNQKCPTCMSKISNQEIELREWLSQYVDITISDRSIISPLEIDIVIPSKKIAIEYNGVYWHSEQRGKDKNYHLNKHLMCKEQGYRLIQIWENEWLCKKDIVKSIILSAIGVFDKKIHGRKCEIRVASSKVARPFYDNNHIQGFKGGEHHGLYYNGELVSLLTINKLNILERFVNKKGCLIHGAFSKLLKSFGNVDGLITFCDIRYFTGNVYEKNGFEHQYDSKPNYFYFRGHDMVLYSRVHFQKHKLKDRLDTFDHNLTEYQNMVVNGYDRIWDCGNMKYIYKNP